MAKGFPSVQYTSPGGAKSGPYFFMVPHTVVWTGLFFLFSLSNFLLFDREEAPFFFLFPSDVRSLYFPFDKRGAVVAFSPSPTRDRISPLSPPIPGPTRFLFPPERGSPFFSFLSPPWRGEFPLGKG